VSDAVDVRQELDLRIGKVMLRFQKFASVVVFVEQYVVPNNAACNKIQIISLMFPQDCFHKQRNSLCCNEA